MKPELEAPESTAVDPFKDSHDHVLAELRRVSALLTLRANAHLVVSSANAKKLIGAHLDENDILQLIEAVVNPEFAFKAEQSPPEALKNRFKTAKADAKLTGKKRQASREAGLLLRLDSLCMACGLSAVEQDVVLLLLLAELDPNSGLLFAYLNDDLTRRFPTVHGLSGTLGRNYRESTELVRLFAPQSPLCATSVIRIHDEGSPLADTRVRLSPTVVHYLLQMPGPPASLDSVAEYLPSITMETVQLESQDELSLLTLCTRFLKGFQAARQAGRPGVHLVLSLDGMNSSDYRYISQAIAHQLGVQMLSLSLADLVSTAEPEHLLRESLLFARLTNSVLFLDQLKSAKGTSAVFPRELSLQLQRAVGLIVTDGNLQAICPCSGISLLTLHLKPRTRDSRLRLWQKAMEGSVFNEDVDLSVLSNAFHLDVEQIQASVEWAQASMLLKEKHECCVNQSPFRRAVASSPTIPCLNMVQKYQFTEHGMIWSCPEKLQSNLPNYV